MAPTKGIIYYSDCRLDEKIATAVRDQLKSIGLPIVSATLEPLDFGKNIHVNMERGYHAYFTQILTALENSDSDIIFFCEHDNLLHRSHFDFTPPSKDKFYYDLNWYKVHKDGVALHWDAAQVSGLVCYRDLALKHYASRLATFNLEKFDRKFEPTVETEYETWWAEYPSIDIRHDKNLTYNKRSLADFRDKTKAINFHQIKLEDIPGWSNLSDLIQ